MKRKSIKHNCFYFYKKPEIKKNMFVKMSSKSESFKEKNSLMFFHSLNVVLCG